MPIGKPRIITPRERERRKLLRSSTSSLKTMYEKSVMMTQKILAKARENGYVTTTPLEALVCLGYTKPKALEILTAIFVNQGRENEQAKQLAKRQIGGFWEAALRKRRTLIKQRAERERSQK